MPGLTQGMQQRLSRIFLCWLAIGLLISAVTLITSGEMNILAHTETMVSLVLPGLCLILIHANRVIGLLLAVAGLPVWLGLQLIHQIRRDRLSGISDVQNNRC